MTADDAVSTTAEPAGQIAVPTPIDLDRWSADEDESRPRWNDVRSIWRAYWRVVVSAAGHLILILWVVGLLATQQNPPPENIPVEIVAADPLPAPTPPPGAAKPAVPNDAAEALRENQKPAPAAESGDHPAPAKPADPTGMSEDSRVTTLTQEERNALILQARRCWNIPAGWTDPRQVSATIRFRLNRDGSLNGTPEVVEFHASQLGKAAADDAVRALERCGPYRMPPDKYDEWKDVQMRFAP